MPARPLRFDEAHLAALLPAESELGPAMKDLNDRQRVFVVALLNQGTKHNQSAAARAAGYEGDRNTLKVTGHNLAHSPKVQAAILEEAKKRMQLGTAAATALLLKVIGDPKAAHRDRVHAANSLLDRGGIFVTKESKIEVTDNSRKQKLLRLVELARQQGDDPRKYIGNLADAEDAEILAAIEGDFKVLKEDGTKTESAGNAP